MSLHVLVTSSRTWNDVALVYRLLNLAVECSSERWILLTHGDAPRGGDRIARRWAEANPHHAGHDPMPADWDRYGNRAGFLRNEQIVAKRPDICLAFIDPCVKPNCSRGPEPHDSHGADHTVGLCEFERIPVEIFRRMS